MDGREMKLDVREEPPGFRWLVRAEVVQDYSDVLFIRIVLVDERCDYLQPVLGGRRSVTETDR